MTPLILDPDAEEELEDSIAYYEYCQAGLGMEYLAKFEAACSRLHAKPTSFRRYFDQFRKCNLHRFPYGIVYSIEPELIYIIAVAHLHRKPFYWKDRIRHRRGV